MAFNIVQTQQEADKFTYKKNQSTVLYTIDTKNINIHGCNVITKTPTAGDVLCVTQRYKQNSDSSGWTLLPPQSQDIVWVKGDTVNMDVWPTETIGDIKIRSIEPVGICYKVRDRKAYVLYGKEVEDLDEIVLAKAYRFKADIITVPSTTANVHIKVGNTFDETFSVSGATNLRQFCINMQTSLANIGGRVSCQYIGPHEYDPLDTNGFYTGDDGVMVLNVKQDTVPNITISINGTNITLEGYTCRDVWQDIASHKAQYFHRNNGTRFNTDYGNTSNFDLFYEYVGTSGRTLSAQPSSPIDTNGIPINESTWNTANAKIYRDAYGSYKKYVESCMMNIYCGMSGATLNRGHKHTQMLAKARYIDPDDGEVKPLYLAPYLCNNVSINAIGLEAGRWWMPSIGELSELFSGTIESNNIDMINSMFDSMFGELGFAQISTYDSDYKYLSCTPSTITPNNSYNYYHGGANPEDTYFRMVLDDINNITYPIVRAITAVDI